MSTPDLSILMPGIRPERWPAFYEAVTKSFSGTFELIIVGPHPDGPDDTLNRFSFSPLDKPWTFIADWGSPIRAQQIALLAARGNYLAWASDDGIYQPGMLDRGFELLAAHGHAPDVAVTSRYLEGELNPDDPGNYDRMMAEDYWRMGHHDLFRGLFIPPEYFLLNVCLVPRAKVLELGGWDCRFETHAISWLDFAVRAQRAGLKVVLQDGIAVKHGHMPGRTGDHAPMHDAQIEHDEPLFREIYGHPDSLRRRVVPLDNWKDAPARWERRFGKG